MPPPPHAPTCALICLQEGLVPQQGAQPLDHEGHVLQAALLQDMQDELCGGWGVGERRQGKVRGR